MTTKEVTKKSETISKKTKEKSEIKNKFKINVFDKTNKIVNNIELNEEIWGQSVSNELISFVVNFENAAKRQGTKKVKERGDVSGGGKKPWKQKGTGRARAGSIRSPIFRGGGITFGPTGNENYTKKVNKKVYKKAILGTLNQIFVNNKLILLKEFEMEKPSTSLIKDISKNFNILGQKTLFVVPTDEINIILSLRNMKNYKIVSFDNLTIFDLLNSKKIIIFEKLLKEIEQRLKK